MWRRALRKYWLIILGAILGLTVFVTAIFWSYYNSFVTKEQHVDAQWSQVETQYQRRFDLIPNLVGATKGALKQEQRIFSQIAEARTRYAGATTTEQKVRAANQVESALARLLVIVENYPQLRSMEVIQNLMIQLEGTENRIAVERRRYNEAVREFNVAIKRFPAAFFANIFGFDEKPYFKSVAGAAEAPQVDLENE
jgi:LemA protein